MKKLILVLMLCLMAGCSVNKQEVKDSIYNELKDMSNAQPITYTTMKKELYSYYLPKDVGRISSNDLSSLLQKDGVKFIMNFNPNRIVAHDYYLKTTVFGYKEPEYSEDSKTYLNLKGTFKGNDEQYHHYTCAVTELGDNKYLLILDMSYVNFTAVVNLVELQPMIHSMMVIAKSFKYNATEVIAAYSLKYTADSIIHDLEEYKEEIPQSGLISQLQENPEEKE